MESPRFSQRTAWDWSLNPHARLHAELTRAGNRILDLTESNPTRCGFQYPNGAILAALANRDGLTYAPEARGLRSGREAVASYYHGTGRAVSADQVILCASTSEAYSWLFKLLCDAGDEVLIPSPSYPLFEFLARLEGVRLVPYPLEYEGRWSVPIDELARRMGPAARALVVVQPNNPTGSFYSIREMAEVERLCLERGCALISDEVFWDYTFEDAAAPYPSALDLKGCPTFTLGGLSKAAGLPQMKLSWIVAGGDERAAHEAMGRLDIIGDTFLSVNTPVQCGLPALLEAGKPVRRQIAERVRENREHLLKMHDAFSSWRCLAAEGGWYAVLRVPSVVTDEEWALSILGRDHVYVHPGHLFDFASGSYLVMSLLPEPETFREAIGRVIVRVEETAG